MSRDLVTSLREANRATHGGCTCLNPEQSRKAHRNTTWLLSSMTTETETGTLTTDWRIGQMAANTAIGSMLA